MSVRVLAITLLVVVCPSVLSAATIKTDNFTVTAPSEAFARQVGEAAEYYRNELAIAWLGKPLPGRWSTPCPIKCKVGQIGAGGATTFTFNNGEVFGWHMSIQGSEERILDSVLPHEVSHMIFASHFRRPLPRWADEGAATLVEHESERLRQTKLLNQVIRTSKRIPLAQLLNIKEYPQDMQDVLTLYAEGYSLADYLVQQKGENGKAVYLQFLGDAHRHGWDAAFKQHYDTSIADVEQKWTGWVMAGSPPITPTDGTLLATADPTRQPDAGRLDAGQSVAGQPAPKMLTDTVVRGQSTNAQPAPTQLVALPSVPRSRRTADAAQLNTPRLNAPRPRMSQPSAIPQARIVPQRHVYPGEHRMTAQPPEPTTLLDRFDSPLPSSHPSPSPERTSAPAGTLSPTSRFDAPTGTPDDRMSSLPIAASPSSRGSVAVNGLGPDSTAGFPRPDRTDVGTTPHRGFSPGRHSPPPSARGLFSRN